MLEQVRAKLARATPQIWVVGDIMLDRYLIGTVERVSPEAPVPVLHLRETQHRAGGAANVAQNLAALTGRVALGGVVGDDADGAMLAQLLGDASLGVAGMLRSPRTITTVKTRALAGAQQLLRMDHELPNPLSEAERAAILDGLASDVPHPDIVLVSDYGKGVISAELLAALRARAGGAPIFVDPKGRDYSRYRGAALITPNEREASLATGIEIRDEASLVAAAQALAAILPGTEVLITRGARGMMMLSTRGESLHAPAQARRVFDVTGAGDTAIAALAFCRALTLSWPEALRAANVAAGLAVGKIGAAPIYLAELLAALSHQDTEVKIVPAAGLPDLRRATALMGQRLVFTNGCFDLLHVGHLRLLQAARALGDALIVAVNSDASVRRLKGETRPVVRQEDRAALLAGLEAVDFVTIFEEDTPLQAILGSRPDVLVKGGDYTRDTIVGAPEVEGWGGQVEVVPLIPGRSTTGLIAKALG